MHDRAEAVSDQSSRILDVLRSTTSTLAPLLHGFTRNAKDGCHLSGGEDRIQLDLPRTNRVLGWCDSRGFGASWLNQLHFAQTLRRQGRERCEGIFQWELLGDDFALAPV